MKGVARNTLHTYVKKCKNYSDSNNVMMKPNYASRKIFTDQEEEIIEDYAIRCSQMNFGLRKFDFRQLVYEVAVKNDKNVPDNWHRDKSAGSDWYQGFMKRNPSLSLRKPESCSLTRATSFNKHNVQVFFSKLKAVFERNPTFANGLRLYNLDETATTTAQKAPNVIALKGTKQVSQVASAERGTLVTTCCIMNASENALPPAMVFPRARFKQHMINEA